LPTIQLVGSPTFCTGGSTIITAIGGISYLWSTNLGANPAATIATSGTYSVTATAANACQSAMNITISEIALPATPTIIQQSDSLQIAPVAANTTILWYFNNTLLANHTNSIFAGLLGQYRACLVNSQGCQSCSNTFQVTNTVGENPATTLLQLSPNPTIDHATLTGLPTKGYILRVFNAIGQIVFFVENNASTQVLDTSTWITGIYRISVFTNDNKTISLAIMVEK
jgi:PKD repeat protein